MKKGFKAIVSLLFVAAFVLTLIPAAALAAPPDNTAYLSFADQAWALQYWGDDVDTGIVATNATVTGPGQYTVGLDFTGTAEGKAANMAFIAPQIKSGATTLPGYTIRIDKIEINGKEISFTKGYTNDEEGNIRMNIYNEWASVPADARSWDGDLTDVSPVIVSKDDFVDMETIFVTFTLFDAEGNSGEAADAPEATTPKTGVTSMALVYGLGALATGALVFKRRKK